jgi:nucleotide-binding universal stress UspA family protein
MYDKIVVGCNGREHDRDALALADSLAQRTGGELTLVCAVSTSQLYPTALPLSAVEPLYETAHDEAEQILRRAAAQLSGGVRSERRVLPPPSPAQEIYQLAEGAHADLIVLGSSHRGALGRVFAGSVGQQVIDAAPCAVAIAPVDLSEHAPAPLAVVAVGYDGGPDSMEALAAGAELARVCQAKLELISVVPPSEAVVPPPVDSEVYARLEVAAHEQHERILEEAVATLNADIDVRGQLVFGPIAPTLEAAAAAAKADVLVVGSRRFGPVRRVLLGSVSAHLITASARSVVVVPRAAGEADEPSMGDAGASRAGGASAR